LTEEGSFNRGQFKGPKDLALLLTTQE